jgi:SNF2 family DNA or RNA helicase
MKRLLFQTEKAFQFLTESGEKQWVPKSICKLVSPKSAFDKNGDLNTCPFDIVIAPFMFEKITGRVPQPIDTPSPFNREAHADDVLNIDVEIAEPNYKLLAHQKECVGKFIKQNKAALFMDMGTGKTITALCLAHSWTQAGLIDTIIVICPVSLKTNWRIKSNEYYDEEPDFVFGSESLSFDTTCDAIEKQVEQIDLARSVVIVDESHFFKHHNTKRTCRLIGMFGEAAFKLVLTGTPITQNAADLFTQMGFLSYDILGFSSYDEFEKSHLLLDERNKIVGYTGIEDVVANASPYVFQIKSEECLNLPEKRYDVMSFDMSQEQREAYHLVSAWFSKVRDTAPQSNEVLGLMIVLQRIASGFIPYMDDLIKRVTQSGWNISEDVLDSMGRHVSNDRTKLLKGIVSNENEQSVVFYRFNSEYETLKQLLPKAGFLSGKTPVKERQKIVEQFRDGKKRIIVCQIQVGGIGFDLETSSNIVFFSTDWSLANRLQAEARCWRKGQDKHVRIIDLVAKGTIEEEVAKCIARKKDIKHAFESEINKITGQRDVGNDTNIDVGWGIDTLETANSQMEFAY